MIIFPNIDDRKKLFKGVIINKIIKINEKPIHVHTFCVDFENSIMEKLVILVEDIVKI
jgi:hypothetical protein